MSIRKRIFRFGNSSRLSRAVKDPQSIPPLTIYNIFMISPADIIITPRPRSFLIEFLFLLRRPERRPAILNFSDGYIFCQNSLKSTNLRYGWLNKYVLADKMIISQPINSIKKICSDLDAVTTTTTYEVTPEHKNITSPIFVFISGNDPYFDLSPRECVKSFRNAIDDIRNLAGAATPIYLSTPCSKLQRQLLLTCEYIKPIGRLSGSSLDLSQAIFIGSPSTALHDQFLLGRPTYILPIYGESGFEQFCPGIETLESAEFSENSVSIYHNKPTNLLEARPLTIEAIAEIAKAKRHPSIRAASFFKEIQTYVLFNEVKLLISGLLERKKK